MGEKTLFKVNFKNFNKYDCRKRQFQYNELLETAIAFNKLPKTATKLQSLRTTTDWTALGILKSMNQRDHYQTKHAKAKSKESKHRFYALY